MEFAKDQQPAPCPGSCCRKSETVAGKWGALNREPNVNDRPDYDFNLRMPNLMPGLQVFSFFIPSSSMYVTLIISLVR